MWLKSEQDAIEYTLSEEDYAFLLEAINYVPPPAKKVGPPPENKRSRLNYAWGVLGYKIGFDPWTVKPIKGTVNKFTAVPMVKRESLKK